MSNLSETIFVIFPNPVYPDNNDDFGSEWSNPTLAETLA